MSKNLDSIEKRKNNKAFQETNYCEETFRL